MKNMMSFFRKNGFYVMALVLIAGILAISGIAGYVSGQSERNQAENAAEFKDRAAGTASNEAKLAESEAAVADEMTGYNADLVQKILSMIENGTLALEDFEEEGSMNGTAEASAKDAADAENEPAEAAEDEPEALSRTLGSESGSVLCCRIFVAEQAVGRLVLLDFWEAADWGIEAVVGIIVVALTDLAQ